MMCFRMFVYYSKFAGCWQEDDDPGGIDRNLLAPSNDEY